MGEGTAMWRSGSGARAGVAAVRYGVWCGLLEDFDDTDVLGADGDTVGAEVEEVSVGRDAVCGGIPPVVGIGDVGFVVYAATGTVVDEKFVVVEAVVLQ